MRCETADTGAKHKYIHTGCVMKYSQQNKRSAALQRRSEWDRKAETQKSIEREVRAACAVFRMVKKNGFQ